MPLPAAGQRLERNLGHPLRFPCTLLRRVAILLSKSRTFQEGSQVGAHLMSIMANVSALGQVRGAVTLSFSVGFVRFIVKWELSST